MNEKEQQFLIFLRRNVFNNRASGQCREIVLRHASSNGKIGSEVNRFEITEQHRSEEGVRALFDDIMSMALADSAGYGQGVQVYHAQTFHGDSEKQSARFTFRVESDSEGDEENEGSSEPANKQGLIAQQMRHNEVLMKTTMGSITQVINTMQRALARQTDRLESMERERWENMRAIEQIMGQNHERQLEIKKAESRERMMGELMGKLNVLLPVVAQKLLAPKNTRGDAAPSVVADDVIADSVKSLLESLDERQRGTIFGCLSEAQLGLLKNGTGAAIRELLPSLSDSQRSTIFGALKDEQKALLIETTKAVFN